MEDDCLEVRAVTLVVARTGRLGADDEIEHCGSGEEDIEICLSLQDSELLDGLTSN
jgi:hypothetical protein